MTSHSDINSYLLREGISATFQHVSDVACFMRAYFAIKKYPINVQRSGEDAEYLLPLLSY